MIFLLAMYTVSNKKDMPLHLREYLNLNCEIAIIFWHSYYSDYTSTKGGFIIHLTCLVQLYYFEKLITLKILNLA